MPRAGGERGVGVMTRCVWGEGEEGVG